jgi:very-short-patch-repair endonuclease
MTDKATYDRVGMCISELDRFSSPIERSFALGLMWVLSPRYVPGLIRWDFSLSNHETIPDPSRGGPTVWAQAPINKYRIDFLLRVRFDDSCSFLFAVECDGHEFHNRTKKQIERDRERDNALLALDIPTFRLPGSLIYRSPIDCAVETVEQIQALALRKLFTMKGHPELNDFTLVSSARQRLKRAGPL